MVYTLLLGLFAFLPSASSAFPAQTPLDHQALFKLNLERRIQRHPYFKKINLEWVWEYDDFVILVQKPAKMEPGYVAKVAKLRVAESLAMNTIFKGGLAAEYDLGLRSSSPRHTIVVLATGGDMDNYFMARYKVKSGGRTSLYESSDRVLILVQDPYLGAAARQGDWRLSNRHERALQLVHGYGVQSVGLPGPYWFQEALASEISGNNSLERTKKGQGKHSEWAYHRLCAAIVDPALRDSTLLPLSLVLEQTNYRGVAEACKAQAANRKQTTPSRWVSNQAYQATVGALFHYLTQEAPEGLRARMKGCIEAVMKGQQKPVSFEQHFLGVDWKEVQSEFWSHVWKHHQAASPKEELDAAVFALFLNELRGLKAGPVNSAGFEPTTLLAMVAAPEAQLALALAQVLAGEPGLALKRLRSLVQEESAAELSSRVKQEIARVEAWIATRDGYFAYLIDSGKKLILERQDGRMLAAVEAIEDGRLIFETCNRAIDSLPIAGIDPVQLARRMLARKSGYDAGWAAVYPLVLSPEAVPARWLRGDSVEAMALAAAAKDDYPARRPQVEAGTHVSILARQTLADPTSAGGALDDAEPLLDHLRSLWALRETVPGISDMKRALATCAQVLLTRQFETLALSDLLAGDVKQEGAGYVHVVYEFDDMSQLQDWPEDTFEALSHKRWDDDLAALSQLTLRNGELVGMGAISRSHILSLAGPQSLTYEINLVSGGQVSSSKSAACRVSLCTLPGNQYAGAYTGLELESRDPREGSYLFQQPDSFMNFFDKRYKRELLHDGVGKLSVLSGGVAINSMDCETPLVGHAQVFIHSEYEIHIYRIEVWGQLHEGSLAVLRQRWLAQQMVSLGIE